MINLLQFFQGPEGENSSKRLAGISATFVALVIAIATAIHFINTAKDKELIDLIETLCLFSASLLTAGLAEKYLRKYANKDNDNSNNISN